MRKILTVNRWIRLTNSQEVGAGFCTVVHIFVQEFVRADLETSEVQGSGPDEHMCPEERLQADRGILRCCETGSSAAVGCGPSRTQHLWREACSAALAALQCCIISSS